MRGEPETAASFTCMRRQRRLFRNRSCVERRRGGYEAAERKRGIRSAIRSNNHHGAITAAGLVRRGEIMRQGDHVAEVAPTDRSMGAIEAGLKRGLWMFCMPRGLCCMAAQALTDHWQQIRARFSLRRRLFGRRRVRIRQVECAALAICIAFTGNAKRILNVCRRRKCYVDHR